MNLIEGLKAAFSFLSSVFIVITVCFLGIFFWAFNFFTDDSFLSFCLLCFQAGSWCISFSSFALKLFASCWVSWTSQLIRATIQNQSRGKFVAIKKKEKILIFIDIQNTLTAKWTFDAQNLKIWWTCSTAICFVCPKIIRWSIISTMDLLGEYLLMAFE